MSGRKEGILIDFPLPGSVRIPNRVYEELQVWIGESIKQEINRIRNSINIKDREIIKSSSQAERVVSASGEPNLGIPLGVDLGKLIEEGEFTEEEKKRFVKLKGRKAKEKFKKVIKEKSKKMKETTGAGEIDASKTVAEEESESERFLKKVYSTDSRTFVRRKLKRLNLENDEIKRELLLNLYELKVRFESIPFLFRLGEETRIKFKEKYQRALREIEVTNNVAVLDDIRKFVQNVTEKAKEEDKKARFEESKRKAREALRKLGYISFSEKDLGDYIDIEGVKNGKKAHIKILKPESDDTLSPLKIEIDERGYVNEKEWEKEGRSLAQALKSLGMIFEFEETSTHFKGKLLKSAADVIKRFLEREGLEDVEVIVEENNLVSIKLPSGIVKNISFNQGMRIKEILTQIEKSESEEFYYEEREKLMEE